MKRLLPVALLLAFSANASEIIIDNEAIYSQAYCAGVTKIFSDAFLANDYLLSEKEVSSVISNARQYEVNLYNLLKKKGTLNPIVYLTVRSSISNGYDSGYKIFVENNKKLYHKVNNYCSNINSKTVALLNGSVE